MSLSNAKLHLFLLLTSLLIPALALAGTPDASQSDVQTCLVTCPAGDTSFEVVVRDAAGDPCADSVVEIDFCSCSGQQLCAGNGDCGDGSSDKLVASTDASGTAVFALAAGGICDGSLVDIVADGVLLAQREMKTMDLTGNFIVEPDDFPDYSNPANDYNCDGIQNILDFSEFALHGNFAHACEAPVGVLPGTWGAVKVRWK